MQQEQTFILSCPHCTGQIECNTEWIGMKGECPYCHKEFIIQPPSELSPTETTAESSEAIQSESMNEDFEDSQKSISKEEIGKFSFSILQKFCSEIMKNIKAGDSDSANFYIIRCMFFAYDMRKILSKHFQLPPNDVMDHQAKEAIKRSGDLLKLLIDALAVFPQLTIKTDDDHGNISLAAIYLTAISIAYATKLDDFSNEEKFQAMQEMEKVIRDGLGIVE